MNDQVGTTRRTVHFTGGGSFDTSATTAADYLLTPVFIRFFFICIVLYATTMQRKEELFLGFPTSILLWGSILLTSFTILILLVVLNIRLVDAGKVKSIYTPLILVPFILLVTYISEYVLKNFGVGYEPTLGKFIELAIRNTVVIMCYDILHGSFVAPQHPTYIPPNSPAPTTPSKVGFVSEPKADVETQQAILGRLEDSETRDGPTATAKAENVLRPLDMIEISGQFFNLAELISIKSEDHYLSLQLEDRALTARGRLRDAVKNIDEAYGVQINRSAWVAFEAIENIEQTASGNAEVKLKNGVNFRVSNSRKLVLVQGFERYQKLNAD